MLLGVETHQALRLFSKRSGSASDPETICRNHIPKVTNAREDLQRKPRGSLPGASLDLFSSTMVISVLVEFRGRVKGSMAKRSGLLNEPSMP